VGTTVGSIVLIVVLLMFMIIYMSMVNDTLREKTYLNMRDAALYRMENTFYLLDKSLGMTWHISTVQDIFQAGDEAIGCGYDDIEQSYPTNDMTGGYWYETDPGLTKPTDRCPIPIQNTAIPNSPKYNAYGCNPKICLPKSTDDKHLISYLNKKMEYENSAAGSFHNIKTEFEVNDIDVAIGMEGDAGTTLKGDPSKISTDFSVSDDKIRSSTTQRIFMRDAWTTKIDTTTRNDAEVKTYMKKSIDAGELILKYLLYLVSDVFFDDYGYIKYNVDNETYKKIIKTIIESGLSAAEKEKLDEGKLGKISIEYKAFDMKARTTEDTNYGDILLYYDATVKITEGASSAPVTDYSIFDWPVDSRKVTSCFGPRPPPVQGASSYHNGIDIAPATGGNDPVKAAAEGKIIDAKGNCAVNDKTCGSGYGNYVLIEHDDGYYTFYGHLNSVNVAKDQDVDKGDEIGTMGTTGTSTGIHLHFEIRKSSNKLNPCKFIHCDESTINKCSLDSENAGIYYYHDTDDNQFVKRPFTLVFNVKDYLPVLKCDRQGIPAVEFYKWSTDNDMVCCGQMLWVCCKSDGTCPDIQDFPDDRKIASSSTITDTRCKNSVIQYTIDCNDGSFSANLVTPTP